MFRESFSLTKGADLRRVFACLAEAVFKFDLKVTIEEAHETRSQKQNSYLWLMYEYVLKHGGEAMGGWIKEDLHELVLIEHFGYNEIRGFGKRRHKPKRRSSKLSVVEFMDLVDFVHRYFAGYGIVIPDPDPTYRAQQEAVIRKQRHKVAA